jgi:hypothetical protein
VRGLSSVTASYRSGRTSVTDSPDRNTHRHGFVIGVRTPDGTARQFVRFERPHGIAPDHLLLPDGTFALRFAFGLLEEYTNAILSF